MNQQSKGPGHVQVLEANLARALQKLRKRLGISQEQLADDSGYHRTYISQLERGLKSPSLRTLNHLAKALGISTSALVKCAEREALRDSTRQSNPGTQSR